MDQNEKRQLDGQVLDRVFTDKASGRNTSRKSILANDFGISRETLYVGRRQLVAGLTASFSK